MTRVSIIGDSIAMGYGPLVKDLLAEQVEVWQPEENAGTSANVLAHVEEWFVRRPADLIHFNCGLHDLAIDEGREDRRVEVDQYAANLAEILGRMRAGPAAKLVWATITPVIDAWHEATKGFRRHEGDVQRYNAAALAVMEGVPVNDLHGVIVEGGREQCICEDGVHMTEQGNRLLAEAVAGRIREVAHPAAKRGVE
jgi:lysophospholipase L1-like esterase